MLGRDFEAATTAWTRSASTVLETAGTGAEQSSTASTTAIPLSSTSSPLLGVSADGGVTVWLLAVCTDNTAVQIVCCSRSCVTARVICGSRKWENPSRNATNSSILANARIKSPSPLDAALSLPLPKPTMAGNRQACIKPANLGIKWSLVSAAT